MAIKFAVRGTSKNAYKHSGAGKTPLNIAPGTIDPAVVVDAGAIGGFAIDCSDYPNVKGMVYPGFTNSTQTGLISYLHRLAVSYSGSPLANCAILDVSGPRHLNSAAIQGMQIYHNTSGNLIMNVSSQNGTALITANTNLGAWSPVSGIYYDFVVTWNGTTTANSLKVYIDGVLFAQLTPTGIWPTDGTALKFSSHVSISVGATYNQVIAGMIKCNELVIWDEVIDPTASGLNLNGAARVAFVTVTGTLDPTSSTDPGEDNVATGIAYVINGVSKTGNSDEPDQADVREGVDYDNATKIGTLVVPDPADVREGTDTDNTVGTLAVPDPSEVLFGVDTDNTTGTLAPVTNLMRQAILRKLGGDDVVQDRIVITKGRSAVMQFLAQDEDGNPVSLTGATFATYVRGLNGSIVTLSNGVHTAAADQVADKGEFSVTVSAANSDLMAIGVNKEIVTDVTIAGVTTSFRGRKLLTVTTSAPSN